MGKPYAPCDRLGTLVRARGVFHHQLDPRGGAFHHARVDRRAQQELQCLTGLGFLGLRGFRV